MKWIKINVDFFQGFTPKLKLVNGIYGKQKHLINLFDWEFWNQAISSGFNSNLPVISLQHHIRTVLSLVTSGAYVSAFNTIYHHPIPAWLRSNILVPLRLRLTLQAKEMRYAITELCFFFNKRGGWYLWYIQGGSF